jgi:hypothetical protein
MKRRRPSLRRRLDLRLRLLRRRLARPAPPRRRGRDWPALPPLQRVVRLRSVGRELAGSSSLASAATSGGPARPPPAPRVDPAAPFGSGVGSVGPSCAGTAPSRPPALLLRRQWGSSRLVGAGQASAPLRAPGVLPGVLRRGQGRPRLLLAGGTRHLSPPSSQTSPPGGALVVVIRGGCDDCIPGRLGRKVRPLRGPRSHT